MFRKGGTYLFRFHLFGGKDSSQDGQRFVSPPPPALDIAALKRAEAERSRLTLDALTRGQLPPYVVERLRASRTGELPWTSDLSVQEWAALRRYKMQPLGQVMGSAFYHIGYISDPSYGWAPRSMELGPPTQAMYQSRFLAMNRLKQEAALLGANAVVGVHLEHRGFQVEERIVEYAAFGTAMHIEGLPSSTEPVLCSVSGQDFARLAVAGALPVGLALGASFYYLLTDWWDSRQERSFYNQEMQHFTRGVGEVRRLATRRMKEDITRLGGDGVVGAEMTLRVEEMRAGRSTDEGEAIIDHILEVFMLGTVVMYNRRDKPAELTARAVLDLRR